MHQEEGIAHARPSYKNEIRYEFFRRSGKAGEKNRINA
jgi:hypothetical protein